MKQIVINISDIEYEKIRLEALEQRKQVPLLLKERLFHRSFSLEVQEAYDKWLEKNLTALMQE